MFIIIEIKKGNVFLDVRSSMSSYDHDVGFPLFLFRYLANGPVHVDGSPTRVSGVVTSVNCSLDRSTRRMLRRSASCERRASRAIELSLSICGFLHPNRPDFTIQCTSYFRRSLIFLAQ